jgi:hypothetical protein
VLLNKSGQIASPDGQIWSNRLSGWSNIKYFRGHAKICGETTSDLCKFPSLSDQPEVPLNLRGATSADHLYSKGVSTFIENLIKSLDAVGTVVKTTLSSPE